MNSSLNEFVTGWCVCIDYQKLNKATKKDHFPLPFIDEILERLAKHSFFCFLDGYSGYHHIPIHLDDQNKTMHTDDCLSGCAMLQLLSNSA
jgi:hypothetical protein